MPSYKIDNITPEIDPSVFIANNATVVGNVHIGVQSSVWFNCVVRGDADAISIGKETNVQDLTMIHADTGIPTKIGNNVTTGHRCIIHGCTIEDYCLIGMGAIVMNGAKIGRGSMVAAGAVVMENSEVPPYSMVAGIPAKVKKTFEEDIIDMINVYAQVYVERSRGYMDPQNFMKT